MRIFTLTSVERLYNQENVVSDGQNCWASVFFFFFFLRSLLWNFTYPANATCTKVTRSYIQSCNTIPVLRCCSYCQKVVLCYNILVICGDGNQKWITRLIEYISTNLASKMQVQKFLFSCSVAQYKNLTIIYRLSGHFVYKPLQVTCDRTVP